MESEGNPEHITRDYLRERTGRLSQLGGITPFTYNQGKAKGVSALRVRTLRGLEYWVIPDRGMDIFEASFKGQSLCWHSPVGMVHPAYYSTREIEWLRSFFGGLLTTCGMTTAGAPSEDQGQTLGLHGPVSNTPAENVQWSERWEGNDCLLTVSGTVREASVLGPNLLLNRAITTSLQSNALSICDTVENQGLHEAPLMLLYHFNFGFPLLTEDSRIFASSRSVEPATEFAAGDADQWDKFAIPEKGAAEKVYFHTMNSDPLGRAHAVLVSHRERRDFGIALSYDTNTLPEFIQWKLPAANHFVLGLEPANCRSLGRAAERERGTLMTLAPGHSCQFRIDLKVLEGVDTVTEAIRTTTGA